MSFTSQHNAATIDKALSAVAGVATGANPSTATATLSLTDTFPVWSGGGPKHVTWANLITQLETTHTWTSIDIDGGAVDGTVIGANAAAAATFTTLTATGGGSLTGTWTDLGSVTTVDINGGTVDGAIIGGASAAAGTFTDLTATGTVTLGGVLDDLTALGAPTTDGQIIVATGAGAFAYESGATARTSLGLGTGDSPTFAGVTVTGAGGVNFDAPTHYLSRSGTANVYYSSGFHIIDGTAGNIAVFTVSNKATALYGDLTVATSVTVASDLTLASGSITSASGAISFGNENLSTTGTLASGNATVTGTLGVTSTASISATFNSGSATDIVRFTNTAGVTYTIGTSAGLASVDLPSSTAHRWRGGATEYGRFDTSGNLLIGATSTSSNAQFYATKTYSAASGIYAGQRWDYTQDTATTGSVLGEYSFLNATHTTGTVGQAVGTYLTVAASGAGGTTTDLWGSYIRVGVTNATASATNAMSLHIENKTRTGTITNDWAIYSADTAASYLAGSLRIGTTSATSHGGEKLHISAAGSTNPLAAITASDSSDVFLQFANSTTGTAQGNGFQIGIDSTELTRIQNKGSYAMAFFTNATERFRVASNAYALGVGTTDVEAWGSGFGVLEFGRSAILASRTTQDIYFSTNAYYDTGWKYKSANPVALHTIGESNDGRFVWYTAASGTIDTPVSFSEKMRLTNGGNLLLGGTTEATSAAGAFHIFNGTAPTGSVTNGVVLYAEDVTASSELKVRDEAGNVTTLSPHNFSLFGPEYAKHEMAWSYYSELHRPDGSHSIVNADMHRTVTLVEQLAREHGLLGENESLIRMLHLN